MPAYDPEKQREYTARWKAKNPARFAELQRARNQRVDRRKYEIIAAAKDVPCADCGGRFPACAMDFDHRDPAEKSFGIGPRNHGFAAIRAEIEKCDVVCANCHRIRHHT